MLDGGYRHDFMIEHDRTWVKYHIPTPDHHDMFPPGGDMLASHDDDDGDDHNHHHDDCDH